MAAGFLLQCLGLQVFVDYGAIQPGGFQHFGLWIGVPGCCWSDCRNLEEGCQSWDLLALVHLGLSQNLYIQWSTCWDLLPPFWFWKAQAIFREPHSFSLQRYLYQFASKIWSIHGFWSQFFYSTCCKSDIILLLHHTLILNALLSPNMRGIYFLWVLW